MLKAKIKSLQRLRLKKDMHKDPTIHKPFNTWCLFLNKYGKLCDENNFWLIPLSLSLLRSLSAKKELSLKF